MKRVFALLTCLGLFLTCGAPQTMAKGDTLTAGVAGFAQTLDPHSTSSGAAYCVLVHLYETLVGLENDKPVPVLAESWRILDDGVSYEFKIKEGVKFHNGETMTVDDVVFSFERALSPTAAMVKSFSMYLDSVTKVDDRTVILKSKIPMGETFLGSLSHPWSSIFSKKAVEAAGLDYGQSAVGTGKFKVVNFVSNERLEMVAFDDYHGKKARLKNLVLRNLSDATTRTIELESGAVEAILDVSPIDISRIQDNPDLEIVSVPSYRNFYIGLTCTLPPYDNPKVRQAMNIAINRAGMVKAFYRGYAIPARGPIPEIITYDFYQESPDFEYNPEKAKQLLAEAGFPNGFKGTLITSERTDYQALSTIAQSDLRAIGIDVDIQVYESGAFYEAVATPNHHPFLFNWGGNVPTGDAFFSLNPVFHSSAAGSGNRAFYMNPVADDLMDRAVQSTDIEEKTRLYKELWDLLNKDVPHVTLLSTMNVNAQVRSLKGVKYSPSLTSYFGDAYFEE